jgi:hypothetical protein
VNRGLVSTVLAVILTAFIGRWPSRVHIDRENVNR